ncbi:MAG: flippase-like domain-containing protein [Candidatus Omnitrophica bacterium]|nr:flippase-like domain-containing protein [Candidatus Omnitrophota bacterium]
MVKKYIRLVSSLAVTFIIFILLFRNIPFAKVFNSIENADFRIISFVLLISIFNGFFVSSFRWKLILNKMGCDISWKESMFIKVGSDPIISSIPFKAGEISRVAYLRRRKNIPVNKAILSIFIEYILNISVLLFFIVSGSIAWLFQGNGLPLTAQVFPFFGFLKGKGFLSDNKWVSNLKECFKSHSVRQRIFLNKKILFYTFLLGFLELSCIYLIARGINIDIPLFSLLIYMPLVIFASGIPITFLGLGIRESFMVFLFVKYASCEKILALGILYSFAEHILPMLIGLSLTPLFVNKIIASRK